MSEGNFNMIKIITYICVLGASMILGQWYITEYRRARANQRPWYRAYFSIPGLCILFIVILLPVFARYF